jgi:hypothetical protein
MSKLREAAARIMREEGHEVEGFCEKCWTHSADLVMLDQFEDRNVAYRFALRVAHEAAIRRAVSEGAVARGQ